MIRTLLRRMRHHYRLLRLQRQFRRNGLEMHLPFSDFNETHLVYTPPVYIGPDAWLELRGKLHIGSGTIIGPRLKVHTSNHR